MTCILAVAKATSWRSILRKSTTRRRQNNAKSGLLCSRSSKKPNWAAPNPYASREMGTGLFTSRAAAILCMASPSSMQETAEPKICTWPSPPRFIQIPYYPRVGIWRISAYLPEPSPQNPAPPEICSGNAWGRKAAGKTPVKIPAPRRQTDL